MIEAGVVFFEKPTNLGPRLLVVWNDRFETWTLPGGKRDGSETLIETMRRELIEECNVDAINFESNPVFVAVNQIPEQADCRVSVFLVREIEGTPRMGEPGRPVTWMSRTTLLRVSRFKSFYEKLFAVLDDDA